jgi:hypothetical protein
MSKMFNESIEYIIPSDLKEVKSNAISHYGSILHYIDVLHKDLNFDPTYIFTSINGQSMFLPIKSLPNNKPFPNYFYELQRYNNKGYDLYLSPNIEDSVDEAFVYVTDKSIQSLVYSIQNMEYLIEYDNGLYKHTINYDFYDCDFTCYKLVVRDLARLRDIKISNILNEN